MNEYYDIIKKSVLFDGIDDKHFKKIFECTNAKINEFSPNEFIFHEGDAIDKIGILITGSLQIEKNNIYGNRTILNNLVPGDIFGEVFVCSGTREIAVSVAATEKSGVLLLEYQKFIDNCSVACEFHKKMLQNMIKILAVKSLILNEKLEIMSYNTTREKLMAYLIKKSNQTGSKKIIVPFDRQELADYLSVNRSALSREMAIMKRDGLISYSKNLFELF